MSDRTRPGGAAVKQRAGWRRWLGVCAHPDCVTGDLDQQWLSGSAAWYCNGCFRKWRDDAQVGTPPRIERLARERRRRRLAGAICTAGIGLITAGLWGLLA